VSIKNMPGSYITLNRSWKNGDIVELSFPMTLRLASTNHNVNKAAILYGPVVLAGEMGTAGFTGPQPYSNPQLHNDYYTYDYHLPAGISTSLQINAATINDAIKPVAGEKLTFKTVKEGIQLKPLYDIHRERYVVYWDVK